MSEATEEDVLDVVRLYVEEDQERARAKSNGRSRR